jgi:Protein of unknown function (DUF3429)
MVVHSDAAPPKQTDFGLGWARWLGLAGLVPFMFLAGALWMAPASMRTFVASAEVHYAASVLSFLGALHWGFALASPGLDERHRRQALVWGVLPSIYSWLVVLAPARLALGLLVAGLLIVLGVDQGLYRRYRSPAGWLALRWVLTIGAAASLTVSVLSPGF